MNSFSNRMKNGRWNLYYWAYYMQVHGMFMPYSVTLEAVAIAPGPQAFPSDHLKRL
jgi:hypothetical protein